MLVLTPLKCALNGLLQGLLSLVQFPLNLHDAVSIVRVLELFDVPPKVALGQAVLVGLQAGLVRPRRLGELAGELVQDLAQQLVRDELVVVLVGDDDAGAPLAAGVDVDGELVLGLGLAGAGAGGFGDGAVDLTADFADTVAGDVLLVGVGEERYGGCCIGAIADYTPATGEAGEMLVDGVDAAQLGRGLVVVLPDLFRRSASCRYRRRVRPEGVVGVRRCMRYPWWRCLCWYWEML